LAGWALAAVTLLLLGIALVQIARPHPEHRP
jgi:hypothetical protein